MYRLENDYVPNNSSVELPGLTSERINQNLVSRDSIGETKLIQRFRNAVSRPGDTAPPGRSEW